MHQNPVITLAMWIYHSPGFDPDCETYSKNNTISKGEACCNGYALAFQMMMDSCGIDCRYVFDDSHAWNEVYLDGAWYNIDLTWDDVGGSSISYDFFLKNNADFPDHDGAGATAIQSYSGTNQESVSITIDIPWYYSVWFTLQQNKFATLLLGAVIIALVVELIMLRKLNKRTEED